MDLLTTVDGSSGTCTDGADWVRDLAGAADRAGDDTHRGLGVARADWRGPASAACQESVSDVGPLSDQLADTARRYEGTLREFASSLDAVNARMNEARGTAAAGGLEVVGPLIKKPVNDVGHQPGMPVEVCAPGEVRKVIGVYQGDLQAYFRRATEYDRRVRLFNDCKAIVEDARKMEARAHHALRAALAPPPGSDMDNFKVGTTTAARALSACKTLESPRKEALMHAERLRVEQADFFRKIALGQAQGMDWELEHLQRAANLAGAGREEYLKKAAEYEKYVRTVPQWARTTAAAYPGVRELHALPPEAGAGARLARTVLKSLPYAGTSLTAYIEGRESIKGQQSWTKAIVDTTANIAGGAVGSAVATGTAAAIRGAPLGPLGMLILGAGGAVVGAIGGQSVADVIVPK
ncbi:hypothetical protein EV193_106235 [Herbihabitans rhizosphaerae]|uniref:Uncharacterized protein n=1 Tax=Herbihabitans rhizosphaerae TaxID=1872711 RepID=A0A4Q7KM75_9PSEU|nr:hypothetical protein [Herbihabitans rhizosphaerae]RZS37000.1 hypothetical protein EV193_106235 [Herbihabitans rhizosphaerae]